jgi:chromate transporter
MVRPSSPCLKRKTKESKTEDVVGRNRIEELRRTLGTGRVAFQRWISDQFVPEAPRVDWRILARTFLKLGATGFGGGVAVIAQIRRLTVHQRRWLTDEEFLDAVSLAQSLPGANAVNAITYIGLKLAGLRGALVSVASFILPSFLIMIGLTVAHTQVADLTDAKRVFLGFNAAVVGLIAATTVRLGKTAVQQQWHLELGFVVAFLLIFTQTTVVEVVLLSGMTGYVIRSYKSKQRQRIRQQLRKEQQAKGRTRVAGEQARQRAAEMIEEQLESPAQKQMPSMDDRTPEKDALSPRAGKSGVTQKLRSFDLSGLLLIMPLLAWPVLTKMVTVWQLVTIFLRVGTITFGGGFVMIPQIETDVCEVYRWMDHRTFADGMAFGQITPGPVLITATFIGYKVAGLVGAVMATLAAFLPSFVMSVVAGSSLDRFRTNFQVQSFLGGVAPAVVGMLAAAGVSLARSGLGTPDSYAVATLAFLLMLRARLNPVVIILLCGGLQWAISRGLIGWLGV